MGKNEKSQEESETRDENSPDDETVGDNFQSSQTEVQEQRIEASDTEKSEPIIKQFGSLDSIRFTDEEPQVHPDTVSAQVNLKVNRPKPGSLDGKRGSLSDNPSPLNDSFETHYHPFLMHWYSRCQNQMTYEETLLVIAQEVGLPLDEVDFQPTTVLGSILKELTNKTINGLTVRSLGDGAHQLNGKPHEPSDNGKQPNSHSGNGDALCDAEAPALVYVRSRLQPQADLYRKGRGDDLSTYQIGSLRSETNRKFGTDFVSDEIEAVWESMTHPTPIS